ncbi:lipopolysaccharide biosynthesis protein [Arthrobacter sp. SDTb3-6]|uniref:lipopolysaccharide biosynthesis protein n=1 Tax=Arthrobacter sp. SDTb3-6 TaxID=2713571 RepID=UPI00159D1E8C|nr:oligosaccharide flippase family protein [Arthrobacter sp. SDTb3-6]NVN00103.1 oligosaccharide flippase family protein [Arthrobacter sp. SDTb3-6]
MLTKIEHKVNRPRIVSAITELGKAAISGGNFLVLAAILGPYTYGNYVVLAAIAAILVPFASVGYASWVQPLAGKSGKEAAAAAALPVIVLVGLPIVAAASVAMMFLGFSSPKALFLVLLAEMTLYPTWSTMTYSLLAKGKAWSYVAFSLFAPATKFMATLITYFLGSKDIATWATTVNISGACGFIVTIIIFNALSFKTGLRSFKHWYKRGLGFAAVGIASALTDNIDRLIVGKTLGSFSVGVYGMAGKLGGYGAVPVRSIAIVAYPQFFELVENRNYNGVKRLMYSIIRRGVIVGIAAWLCVVFACYIASNTLLHSYAGVFICTIILAACIPLRAAQYGAGDVLYALDNSRLRLLITFAGALISAAGAWVGSIHFGLFGGASGLLIAQVIVAGVLIWGAELSINKSRARHENSILKEVG